jgi:serine-type D-Ala-D-Ala carboxypeptidase/endopeptidase (penicillin-binding protein 4)
VELTTWRRPVVVLLLVLSLLPTVAAPAGATSPNPSPSPVPPSPATIVRGPLVARVVDPLSPQAPVPVAARLTADWSASLAAKGLGASVSAEVVDVLTGAVLYNRDGARAAVPASTVKIMTGVAVLDALGPDTRLATTVVSPRPGELVLVGGGDVLLSSGRGDLTRANGRAGLADLAAQVAAALKADPALKAAAPTITLQVDDHLFAGPARSPLWPAGDVPGGFVAPVTALAVDSGNARPGRRAKPGEPFSRSVDPSLAAGALFAAALKAQGVSVGAVTRSAAAVQPANGVPPSSGVTVLGRVYSAPVAEVLAEALSESDNTVAEALARLVAVHDGVPATFAGAGTAVLARAKGLGLPVAGSRLAGGSGLGSGYAISADLLVRALQLAGGPTHPQLRAVITGLPVAGANGTLVERFETPSAYPARGVLRAKTGTLTGTSTLAGTVVDAEGRLLAFAILADRVTSTSAARAALDVAGGQLAQCGCR